MPKSIVFAKDNYFEGIVQLRPYDEEVYLFIEKEIKKRKDNVYIAKIVELKTGIDIYISSQKFVRTLGSKLKKRFKGETKETKTIHTRNRLKSRNVYRATLLFRLKKKDDESDE